MEEQINHPAHYGGDTIYEAIKVIEAWELGFCLGNAVKYVCRAGKKGSALEDLAKARWYLDREIARLTPKTATLGTNTTFAHMQDTKCNPSDPCEEGCIRCRP